ncbi:MAG: type II toxin-antitoxin system MqsR family toxin [Clostridiales bacterium]|nr:type II toxin-antitoxin system MqsR family toxin [Clostridiales bacterium]
MAHAGKREKFGAHYPLRVIQERIAEGHYVIPRRVRRYMDRREWTEADLRACVQALDSCDLHKSQEHLERPGVWLDIYRPTFDGCRRYLKLTETEDGHSLVVLSFCADGEAH